MNAVQAIRLATGAVIRTCVGAGLTPHTIRARDGMIAFLGAGKG